MRSTTTIIALQCCLLLLLLHLHHHQFVAAGDHGEGNTSSASTIISSSSSSSSSSSRIEFLPGYKGTLPFELYTGYIGVPQNDGFQQLFYYFLKSESNPGEDPLILWLTGGPGCSSLTGLLYELGPLEFEAKEYDGTLPTLILTPHSITKVANVIYLDQPARSGYSYATSPSAAHSTDLESCNHVYQFLQKWFSIHSDFRSNRFYIGGDSYSGITVPIISQLISDGNDDAQNSSMMINLKGYILGNPKTFDAESSYSIPFAHGMGLISTELYTSLTENCKEGYEENGLRHELCSQSMKVFIEKIKGINIEQILEPSCGSEFALQNPAAANEKRRMLKLGSSNNNLQRGHLHCRVEYNKLSNYWANDPAVQRALGVRKGSIGQWVRCRQTIGSTTYKFTTFDTRQYHANLSRRGYTSIIYSGDHDMLVPFQSTEEWIKSLNYSIIDDWRQWIVNAQVAGYTRSYSNGMTFATVKGAGHVAFAYKHEECVAMLTRWLSHHPL